MSGIISSWTTSAYPTQTYLKTVATDNVSDLTFSYTSAIERIVTETRIGKKISLSRVIRGVQATQTILSAQQVLATATADSIKAQATEAIFHASVNLDDLNFEENLYDTFLSRPANIIYLSLFALLFLYYTFMNVRSRYWWFNVTFWCGYALEFSGFLGRILSFTDWTNLNYFLLQFVSLTIAPAFIMAGVYFTFAQLVVVYGRHYSVLKPMWYTYLFISFDVISLVIQAIGGGMASQAQAQQKNGKAGTNVMIAGIAFQVVSMTVFLSLWFEFLNRVFFHDVKRIDSSNSLNKRSIGNFFKFLFNGKNADSYKRNTLEPYYNPKFNSIRVRKLLNFYPLAITIASIAIYIRCIYRVVELAQGWTGYLITHEVFLMTLDALMISIAGLIFVPFHPYFVFGAKNILNVSTIRNRLDNHPSEEEKINDRVEVETQSPHDSDTQFESQTEK